MKTLSPAFKALVNILNDGQFHSGSELGQKLEISRNAVWKHINQLHKFSVPVESMQSKGYQLKQTLILLDPKEIKKYAENNDFHLEILASVPSTNAHLKTQNTQGFHICLAEHQSHGKGRFGRVWHSPFGTNIYLSCRWQITKDVSELGGLSLAVSLAIIEALNEFGIEDLKVKWPNDILWRDKKLAGVLVEMTAESYGLTQIIVGIGLNVNLSEQECRAIDRPVASLKTILESDQNRNIIAGLVIKYLIDYLNGFARQGFSDFIKQWQQYDALAGKTVQLHSGASHVEKGTACGVNQLGHLLIKQKQTIKAYSAGEVSLSK